MTLTVYSVDPTDVGNYKVRVSTTSGSVTKLLEIVLDVANGCQADQVTPTSAAIADLTYNLNVDGLVTWTPTWSSSVAGCPLTYEIGRIVATVEQALTAHETATLTHSTVYGSL